MRYIIIPKQDPALGTLSAVDVGFDPESRRRQYDRIVELRRRPLGLEDSVAAARHTAETSPAPVVARPNEATPVTGVTIVDATPAQAAELDASLPDAFVIPDLPLTLIPPHRATAAGADPAGDAWHLDAIGLAKARAGGFRGAGKGIVIAVADTGIEEVDEIRGRVRAAYEIDRTANRLRKLQKTLDTEGHGTHVAGLICGRQVGVAPEAMVENIIMIPQARGHVSDFIMAIEYVAGQPDIAILNMSAGIPGYQSEMLRPLEGLRRAGVFPVIAIGNEGRNTSRSPGNYQSAFAVGASNRDGKVAAFSGGGQMSAGNMSYPVPDCVAPGAGVVSCVMGGGYEAWDGTSMATPIVSGLAALIIERNPAITLAELEETILEACRDLGAPPTRQGAGLVQVPSMLHAPAVAVARPRNRRSG